MKLALVMLLLVLFAAGLDPAQTARSPACVRPSIAMPSDTLAAHLFARGCAVSKTG